MNLLALCVLAAIGQGHGVKPAEALKSIAFLQGGWTGKVTFSPQPGASGAAAMVADVTDTVQPVVGGRYIEETVTTTLPGSPGAEARHIMTFDPQAGKYEAWWFNDTRVGPMELEGTLDGDKLVFESKASAANIFRATYQKVSDTEVDYSLELKAGAGWRSLFKSVYTKNPA